MAEIRVQSENILKTAKVYPSAADALKILFPEVFEDEKVFCRIGTILTRKGYTNYYALFKWNGEVRLLNVTTNKFWDEGRNLKVNSLNDWEFLTISEFKTLIGTSANIEQFSIVRSII